MGFVTMFYGECIDDVRNAHSCIHRGMRENTPEEYDRDISFAKLHRILYQKNSYSCKT